MGTWWGVAAVAAVVVAGLVGAGARAATVRLTPPPVPTRPGNATLLVVLPGAFVPGAEYRALAAAVQARALLPLWTAPLEDFNSDFPTVPEAQAGFEAAMAAARAAGFSTIQDADVWALGHSQGGYVASQVVGPTYGGVILLGA
jgi:hypothetical protein